MKKKFNMKAAQAGAKVVTRDGRQVEIIKYNYKNDYPSGILEGGEDE